MNLTSQRAPGPYLLLEPNDDINKETLLQLKYYFIGWYIYNNLEVKNN